MAVAKYQRIVDLLQFETSYTGEDEESKSKKAQRDSLYHAAHLNIALCCLKQGEYADVIKHTEKVLEEDPKSVKARYRRGMVSKSMP